MAVEVSHSPAAGHESADLASATHIHRARGHFWNLFGGEVGNKILRFAAAVVLARALTPSAFGIFNVGIAIAGILVTASTLGLPELGGRTVAARGKDSRILLVPVLVGRLAALGLVAVIFLAAGLFVWPDERLLFIGTVAVALAMTITPDWLARGLERMRLVGGATMLGGLVALAGAGAVAIVPFRSASLALVAFAVAEATVGLVCWVGIRDAIRPFSPSLTPLLPLLKKSWPLGLATGVTYAYYANVDTVIVAAFHGSHSAGIYSAAYRVFLAFNVISIFAAYATFPILARLTEQGAEAAVRGAVTSTLVQLVAYGACVVGVVEIAGKLLLQNLFGEEFAAAASSFTLLAIASAWYAAGYAAGYSLIAIRRQRGFVAGAIVAGVLTIGFDFALIPPFGMIGAAVATVIGFVGATLVWLHQQRLERRTAIRTYAALISISVGAGIAAAVPDVSAAIGLLTLTTAAILIGIAQKKNSS